MTKEQILDIRLEVERIRASLRLLEDYLYEGANEYAVHRMRVSACSVQSQSGFLVAKLKEVVL